MATILGLFGIPDDWQSAQTFWGKSAHALNDLWVRIPVTIIFLVVISTFWGRCISDYRQGKDHFIIQKLKDVANRIAGRPFWWDFSALLGWNKSERGRFISGFHISFIHKGHAPVVISDAYIEAIPSLSRIDMVIDTPGPYVTTKGGVAVSRNDRRRLTANFYDTSQSRAAGVGEGIPEQDFLHDWKEIDFVVMIGNRAYRKTFSNRIIRGYLRLSE